MTADTAVDTTYEFFDAPMFTNFLVEDDDEGADEWFDKNGEEAKFGDVNISSDIGNTDRSFSADLTSPKDGSFEKLTEVIATCTEERSQADAASGVECSMETTEPTENVCAGSSQHMQVLPEKLPEPSQAESKNQEVDAPKDRRDEQGGRLVFPAKRLSSSDHENAKKRPRRAAAITAAVAIASQQNSKRKSSRPQSASATHTREATDSNRPQTAKRERKEKRDGTTSLTIPATPEFLKREHREKKQVLTTEERELLAIKEARRQQESKRKLKEKGDEIPVFERLQQPTESVLGKSSSNDTKTPRNHLKSKKRAQTSKETRLTVPKSPEFTSRPPKRVADSNEFVPMAVAIEQFQSKTPARFRTSKNTSGTCRGTNERHEPRQLTQPKSPKFHSTSRQSSKIESTEDRELAEIAKMPAFKANPVNYKALNSAGQLGVPKVAKAKLTEPQSPNFASDRRIGRRNNPTEGEKFEFKARPVPESIYEPPVSVTVPRAPPTAPKEFKLATSTRAAVRPSCTQKENKAFKAAPMPEFPTPPPQKKVVKVTAAKPFTLQTDTLCEAKEKQRQERIKKERQEEESKMSFKATPMPLLDDVGEIGLGVPPPTKRPLTEPKPFNFRVAGEEGAADAEMRKIAAQLEAERLAKEAAQFKANPISKGVFQPEVRCIKSTTPLTTAAEFRLNTEARAEARQKFLNEKEMLLKAREDVERARHDQENAMAMEEIKAMREKATFRAKPVKVYAPIQIKKSDRPLTEPLTPNLTSTKRTRQGHAV